jgi:protein-histidine pros-kinase
MLTTIRQRPLDLKRQLLARVSLFALVVLILGTAAALFETRYRVRNDIQRTGQTIRQLVTDEIDRSGPAYSRTLSDNKVDLAPLKPIGQLLSFCIEMSDLYSHVIEHRCFASPAEVPEPLEALMRWVIGKDAVYHGRVGQYAGITAAQMTVTPNYGNEVLELGKKLGYLLAISVMILFLSFFVYRPVRNALAPSAAILETLSRMEKGHLEARMPAFALIELNRIGEGFNHLADRLQNTILSQQRLAHRLLSAREEERQHLARELHDEFGQYLASLNAEAAFARELADEGIPALRPCAEAIGYTASHMMEALQQILHHLRPIGLEEFGLRRSLQQLVDGWNQRGRNDTVFVLNAGEGLDNLPDNINVSIYRIVQESITNAVRHGQPGLVTVTIRRNTAELTLEISDDGQGSPAPENRGETKKSGGFGLLGMEERALALGGSLAIRPAQGNGTIVSAYLPLAGHDEISAGERA